MLFRRLERGLLVKKGTNKGPILTEKSPKGPKSPLGDLIGIADTKYFKNYQILTLGEKIDPNW